MPKRIAPLSDIQIKNAKPKEKEYKLMDGYGLFLLVTPTNGKLWRFDYRLADKRKTVSFGAYPALSLADARCRDEAKKLIANGVDPNDVKKAQKTAITEGDANSFEVVAREWHKKFSSTWSESHGYWVLRRLEQYVFPVIGARALAEHASNVARWVHCPAKGMTKKCVGPMSTEPYPMR
ncbi:MAG: integrase arm-type DNA-binding domain-containing protein [Desulfuromonadaceae bacterium]|nr:integrase arm-type DNA-binding domain-containing protein [Desulfuromonadaceae bacterium]MDD5107775.1 integrase arm-type DNA-binding domain-containing protein [Desulfuromonadaceae bacterium]